VTSHSESSCDSWISWDFTDLDTDSTKSELEKYGLTPDELRALADAEDQAYDELIREATEAQYAEDEPICRTRSCK